MNYSGDHQFVFQNCRFEQLTETFIVRHTAGDNFLKQPEVRQLLPLHLELNRGIFFLGWDAGTFPPVSIVQEDDQLTVSSSGPGEADRLNEQEAAVLSALIRRDELALFFHSQRRHEKLKTYALDYGLEQDPDLDQYFQLEYQKGKVLITPKLSGLLPVTGESLKEMNDQIFYPGPAPTVQPIQPGSERLFVVFKRHKYDKHLVVDLYQAQTTRDGKLKNPLIPRNPLDFIWSSDNPDEVKFDTGIS